MTGRYFRGEVRPGSPVTAEHINETERRTFTGTGAGNGVTMTRWGNSMLLRADGKQAGGGGVMVRVGRFVSLDADGDTMQVQLCAGGDWQTETTTVYKPFELQASWWQDETITFADGETRSFDDDSGALDVRYQRRATWDGGVSTETQEITEAYAVNGKLLLISDGEGHLMDMNVYGRHFAAIEEGT